MTPYKINSLVKFKGEDTIMIIIDRRMYRYNKGAPFIQYTLIDPRKPLYPYHANHDGLIPLEIK